MIFFPLLQALPAETKTSYEKSNAIGKKDETKYSDDEESEEEEIKVIPKQPSKFMKTAKFLWTLLKIILMPTFVLFLVFSCTKVCFPSSLAIILIYNFFSI